MSNSPHIKTIQISSFVFSAIFTSILQSTTSHSIREADTTFIPFWINNNMTILSYSNLSNNRSDYTMSRMSNNNNNRVPNNNRVSNNRMSNNNNNNRVSNSVSTNNRMSNSMSTNNRMSDSMSNNNRRSNRYTTDWIFNFTAFKSCFLL